MFCSLILASTLLRQSTPDITVPIDFTPIDGIPLITARISGKEFTFALDTGNPYAVIVSTETAKKLDIDTRQIQSVDTAGLSGKVVAIPAIDVEGSPVAAHFEPYANAVALDLHGLTVGEKKVDGIFGLPILGLLKTEFDYGARRVVFHRNPLDSVRTGKMTAVHYVERDGAAYLRLGVPKGSCEVSLDTGREYTFVSSSDREKLEAQGSRYWPLFDLYDKTSTERLYVSNVSLAGADLGPSALQLRDRGGLLGNDILRCFRFILDPENGRVLFERDLELSTPSLPGDEFFRVDKKGDRFVVSLAPDADDSFGLKDGDALKEIDGNPLARMNPKIVHDRVVGIAGTFAHLVVERAGKDIPILYKRPSAYSFIFDKEAGRSGIALVTPNQAGNWQILGMKSSGPLWKAGIRSGDVILAIDDNKVAGLSNESMDAARQKLKSGGCVLTVQTGDSPPRTIKFEKLTGTALCRHPRPGTGKSTERVIK